MNILIRRSFFCGTLLFTTMMLTGAKKVVPPPLSPSPDVIAKVTAAKKIFLSNEIGSAPEVTGGANGTYNELYPSLERWGYFQLVGSPAQADLIFAIQMTGGCSSEHTGVGFKPDDFTTTCSEIDFNLIILDPSTRASIWTIVSPVGRGSNISKGQIAFKQSIETLTDKIKALVRENAQASELSSHPDVGPQPKELKSVGIAPAPVEGAPIPSAALAVKNVFIENGNSHQAFVKGLSALGSYTIVDSMEKADAILEFSPYDFQVISMLQPSTRITLWTINSQDSCSVPSRKLRYVDEQMNLVCGFKELKTGPQTANPPNKN